MNGFSFDRKITLGTVINIILILIGALFAYSQGYLELRMEQDAIHKEIAAKHRDDSVYVRRDVLDPQLQEIQKKLDRLEGLMMELRR